jgi:DNA-binding NtrC family response regulator
MNARSATYASPTDKITVLSVSPHDEDHRPLIHLFGHARWQVLTASNISAARELLQQHETAVVVCERDLTPQTWIDMLKETRSLSNAPALIVTSRLADDRLWAEALNLGAYDVLAKPFDRTELLRSVRLAWEHWRREVEVIAQPMAMARVAS